PLLRLVQAHGIRGQFELNALGGRADCRVLFRHVHGNIARLGNKAAKSLRLSVSRSCPEPIQSSEYSGDQPIETPLTFGKSQLLLFETRETFPDTLGNCSCQGRKDRLTYRARRLHSRQQQLSV